MTGEKEPEKILKRLQAKYPNADFVLTYGEKGAWYVGNGETVYCPAKKVKVIDTTAAGDTVYRLFSFCQRKRLWSGRESEKSYSCGRRGSYEKRSRCIYSMLERTGRKIRV